MSIRLTGEKRLEKGGRRRPSTETTDEEMSQGKETGLRRDGNVLTSQENRRKKARLK